MNKQRSLETGSRVFHKRLALRTTIQFITVVIIFEVAYILLNLLFLIIMGTTNLDRTEAFQAFKPFMIPIVVVVSIAGCGYISYRFMLRPLEHLDEVAEAAQKLAHPTDAPIMLSGNLKSMENIVHVILCIGVIVCAVRTVFLEFRIHEVPPSVGFLNYNGKVEIMQF